MAATALSANVFAADDTELAEMGIVRGRVVDTENHTLPGASIFIEDLHTGVVSDIDGFYILPNLKPGEYKVKVTYVGYSPFEMKIKISGGKTVEKNIVLNEGVELQEVIVGGAFQGQRRALNSQKKKWVL